MEKSSDKDRLEEVQRGFKIKIEELPKEIDATAFL